MRKKDDPILDTQKLEFLMGWWDRIEPEVMEQVFEKHQSWPLMIDLEKLEIHPSAIALESWEYRTVMSAIQYYADE